MTIKIGDKLPSVTLRQVTPEGPKEISTDEFFRGKKVALFAVPGAFTPACSQRHLPGYVDRAGDIKGRGVDTIACLAVNDAFVMGAWGDNQKAHGKVRMVADGNGEFTKALGLELDASGFGMGHRSQRFALIAKDGKVTKLLVEPGPGLNASSAESVLSNL